MDTRHGRNGKNTLERLAEVLDRCSAWPNVYVFKFIVPRNELNHLLALLDGLPVSTRESAHGRYVGVTAEAIMASPGDVIAVYERAVRVKGILSF
jgi:hypothetical protein